jgi:hypothetical protein
MSIRIFTEKRLDAVVKSYRAEKKSWDDIQTNDIVIESSLGEMDERVTFWKMGKKNDKSAWMTQCYSDGTDTPLLTMTTRARFGRTKISRWVYNPRQSEFLLTN